MPIVNAANSSTIETILDFLSKDETIEEVVLVCFDDENFALANRFYNQYIS